MKTQIYICHPNYSSEKGPNEKHNGIENCSYEDINKIADRINNYPRKICKKI